MHLYFIKNESTDTAIVIICYSSFIFIVQILHSHFELLHMKSLMMGTPHQIHSGEQIEKNEMGGACSTYGGKERYIQGFGGAT